MEQGLTIIYWGYGKGKTTAAVGLALRALGQGQRVLFMQFMKGEDWKTGEAQMFAKMDNIEFCIVGKGWVRIMGDSKPMAEHRQAAKGGLEFAMRALRSTGSPSASQWERRFNVVILDEILSAVDAGLLNVDDIKDLIRAKPPETHLVMTGHKEYPELITLADVVTKMEKIKHPFGKGVLAQKGIDF